MKALIVGGAGYIGSHMVKMLCRRGDQVVTLDNLSTGYRDAVVGGEFVVADAGDRGAVTRVLSGGGFDLVMHFASFIQVGTSVLAPAIYYRNNFAKTLDLLEAMLDGGVRRFIFSSSAAVFGEPEHIPIDETHPCRPLNPYGRSKHMVEQVLEDFDAAYGLKSVCLRYFNAAGADPEGELGERHAPETHLIPLLLQVASGRRASLQVFGRDYDTPDGTCIRDYIHIMDLCAAHLAAAHFLMSGGESAAFNLGNGEGFSVQEVIDTVRRVTGRRIATQDAPRRPGDPARLVADSRRAMAGLDWQPRYAQLETIVRHAWEWEQLQARGTTA